MLQTRLTALLKVTCVLNVSLLIILRHPIYLEYVSKTLKWYLKLTTILVFAQVFIKYCDAISPIKYYNIPHFHIIMHGLTLSTRWANSADDLMKIFQKIGFAVSFKLFS